MRITDGAAGSGGAAVFRDAAGGHDGPTPLDAAESGAAGIDATAEPPPCGDAHPDACPAPLCPGGLAYHGDFDRTNPTSTVLTDVSVPLIQNVLAGASSDGKIILVIHGCHSDGSLWLYDGDPATGIYTGVDIGAALPNLDHSEGHISLAPDGLTVVANRTDRIGFVLRRRKDRGSTQFLSSSSFDFTVVNDWALQFAANIVNPILSEDGLSFFFMANLKSDPAALIHYEVTRARLEDAFSQPDQPVPGMGAAYYSVGGISRDRLTVFVADTIDWASVVRVLVRPFIGAPFRQVEPSLTAFRPVPIGDHCDHLLSNGTIAGCGNEEVYVLSP